jgi:hypothetical protein
MAISDVCQFEVKEEVDKAILENRVSQAEALRGMKKFYRSIGLEVKFETLRTKYKRACKATGSNEPKKSKVSENTKNTESKISENRKPQGGGKRKGAGRPQIDKSKIISDNFKTTFNKFFEEIQNAKKSNWEHTSQQAALHHVKILYNLVAL